MAIRYVEGNLITAPERIIVHGCNALGAFASGFADVVRKAHPAAYRAYMSAHEGGRLLLGSVIWAESGGTVVGNCITQPTYGRDGRRHVSYDAVRSCMRQVQIAAETGIPGTAFEDGFSRVAMPLIGANLGGGDWSVISSAIAEELDGLDAVVYVLPGRRPSAAELESSPPRR